MWPFRKKPEDGSLSLEMQAAIAGTSIQTRDIADSDGKPRVIIGFRRGYFYWHDQDGIKTALSREFPGISDDQKKRAMRMLSDLVTAHSRAEKKDLRASRDGKSWRDSWKPLDPIKTILEQ